LENASILVDIGHVVQRGAVPVMMSGMWGWALNSRCLEIVAQE
jgi:hypothetical protein